MVSSDDTKSGDEPLDPAAETALIQQLAGLLKESGLSDIGSQTGKAQAASSHPAINQDLIKELAALLTETGLTEIEVDSNGLRLRVARAPAVQTIDVSVPARAAAGTPGEAPEPGTETKSLDGAVASPMVGTVYVAPEPGAAPFVLEGDQVREGQTLLIVEAMKTMNPIPAPKAGTVSRILISDGQPVEYGEPLLLIE